MKVIHGHVENRKIVHDEPIPVEWEGTEIETRLATDRKNKDEPHGVANCIVVTEILPEGETTQRQFGEGKL